MGLLGIFTAALATATSPATDYELSIWKFESDES